LSYKKVSITSPKLLSAKVKTLYQTSILPNGVTVASASMPQMASVCLGIWAKTGSRYESLPDQNGISHFIEHLLFKGTPTRSSLKISEDIEGIGGASNAFTAEENTCYFARSRGAHLEQLMDVQMDMYCHSVFNPEEIRKEREIICEEIDMIYDQPSQYVQELLNTIQWRDHPLGRPITGTEEGLQKIHRKNILQYFQQHYIANNTWIIAAGNVSHEKLVRLAGKYSKHIPTGPLNQYIPFVSQQQESQVLCVERDVDQTQFALGIRTFARFHPSRYAIRMINTLVGENSSSHLFQVIREDEGLAYSIGSSASAFYDIGDLVISAGVDENKVEKTVKLVLKELKRLASRPLSKEKLKNAQDYIIGQLELSLESTENQMVWLGEQLLSGGRFASPETIKRGICKTTAEEIQNILQQILSPERYNLTIVGSHQNSESLRNILQKSA
jgi:predicted Zn-dependent peptidase